MENIRIVVFSLIFSMLFPVLGYTFTTYTDEPTDYDISINVNSLVAAGITLSDAESHNLTWEGAAQEYDIENITTRASFEGPWSIPGVLLGTANAGDGVGIEKQGPVDRVLDTWIFPNRVNVKSDSSGRWSSIMTNSSMVNDWNPVYNWSLYHMDDGRLAFITYPPEADNISHAVYTVGNVTLTIGEGMEESDAFNFRHFVGWYMGLIIGDQSWGLPPFFSWIMRIISAITVLSTIILAREMLPG